MESLQLLLDMFLALFQLLLVLWPVWAVLGALWAIKISFKLYRSYWLSKAGIAEIDKMNGKDFEKYLEALFKKLGYRVKRTSYRGDYGADLVIQKDGEKTVVQAKRYKKKVGIKAVQEAAASKEYYGCNKAMVVTNSQYTQQAINLAQANKVELWDRKKLAEILLAVKKDMAANTTAVMNSAPTGEGASLTILDHNICQICQKPVSQSVKDYCLAHQGIFGGKIYCYDHQRNMRRKQKTSSKPKIA